MAFEVMDEDKSGGLDYKEIRLIMEEVADKLGVTSPTEADINSILRSLDNDSDGVVSKVEFSQLVKFISGKMVETEEQA